MFTGADFVTYYGDDDAGYLPAAVEDGDVHVLGNGAVLIGMGERTTPMAVEILARALFASGQARAVIAVELPKTRAMMHLDTVMTMVDVGTFVIYPYFDRRLRSWTLTAEKSDPELAVSRNRNLWDTLAAALGLDMTCPIERDPA
jgi:arginine deiminase